MIFLKNNWKLLLPPLFALAILLGVLQHGKTSSYLVTSQKPPLPDKSLLDFYNASQQLSTPNTPQTVKVSFMAVGDINLSRNVALAAKDAEDGLYPFRGMQNLLHSVNFNFANLESPFSERPIIGGHSLIFGAPTSSLDGLIDNNFFVLNLANNHAFDGGLKNLDFTSSILDKAGVKHTGTGDDLEKAWQPAILEMNGFKLCFVGASYASANDGGKSSNDYVARMEDLDNLKSSILNLKSQCDFIVATMHGGVEYTRRPNDLQTSFAHAAIDYGADVVIGAHPHWVQTIEKYKNQFIFYSLGNFIFDQAWSRETSEGLTLKITLSKNSVANAAAPKAATLDDLQGGRKPATLESIELIPVIITNSQPRPATEVETKKILQKIGETETLLK